MAKRVQLRRGTTTEHNSFIGAVGEVTVDTTKDVPVVHDGVTVGGHPVASKANADGTISLIKKDGTSAGIINATGLFNNTLTSTNTNQALTAAQGKALNDQAFGIGQTQQRFTTSRFIYTTYTNSTGKPIEVRIIVNGGVSSTGNTVQVGGVDIYEFNVHSNMTASFCFTVQAGDTYRLNVANTINSWSELR